MPFVEIKVIDGVFGTEEKAEMVRAVTEAMLSVEGEAMRQVTWVTVNSVASGEWGIGGQLLTTEAVQALRGQTATAGAR
jgi:4-oxalocrotonate tautomerase